MKSDFIEKLFILVALIGAVFSTSYLVFLVTANSIVVSVVCTGMSLVSFLSSGILKDCSLIK